ncbi:aspartate/glutamate racemase family protein [Brevibacillus sp. SIMBA_040]|uniref:aspartate/glutamate racemase family protein n=1 Tax=unclassified Brevibacillus TaxID=2684853 RepID=UPI00397ADB8F
MKIAYVGAAPKSHEEVGELIQKSGLASKIASVRAVNIPVLDLAANREVTLEKLVRIGREAIDKDCADVLVLGCMSMAFLQVAEEMQKLLGIPVINPAKAALKLAESLACCGLKQSKAAISVPPKLSAGK